MIYKVLFVFLFFYNFSFANNTNLIKNNAFSLSSNKSRFYVNGMYYNYDCSGYVLAVWDKSNIKTLKNLKGKKGENLVYTIYKYLLKKNKIYRDYHKAKIGDLIFFHNTYDKNRNNRVDDYFSHIGIIVGIDKEGTISFLHRSSRGIRKGVINLVYKDKYKKGKKIINSFLRKKKRNDFSSIKYLSGELFACFGSY